MEKFKKGDIVKVISDKFPFFKICVNKSFKILAINSKDGYLLDTTYLLDYPIWYNGYQLKKVSNFDKKIKFVKELL